MKIKALILSLFFFLFTYPAFAERTLQLGKVDFPTSTQSPEAQQHFNQGLTYLHNFMYQFAIREFILAQQSDPQFALSYWGILMCYHWPLWSYLNLEKGQEILKNMHYGKSSPLEKDMLNAIAIMYGSGNLIDKDKKYMEAMEKIYKSNPKNPDIVSFYALAILQYINDDPYNKNNENLLAQNRDLLKPFIKKFPAHPGVLHYFIHSSDIPNSNVAKQALFVIKNIYRYLSDSSHVLHMPSHLYTVLGNWKEAAYSNTLSIRASDSLCNFLKTNNIDLPNIGTMTTVECDADNRYHSLEWLHYADLQLGKFKEGQQAVDTIKEAAQLAKKPMFDFWWYRMQARQTLSTHDWLPLRGISPSITKKDHDIYWAAYSEAGLLLAEGLRAIHNKQLEYLPLINDRFQKILIMMHAHPEGIYKEACKLNFYEFLAAKEFYIHKNKQQAFQQLDKALAIQYHFQNSTQPLVLPFLPVQELYAEFLLKNPKQGDVQKAIDLYKNELKFQPNRREATEGIRAATVKERGKR